MGTISPCQVTGPPAFGPAWTSPGLWCPVPRQQGICRIGFPAGGRPPSAQQLSGLKNEMEREIYKLRVLKNLFVG